MKRGRWGSRGQNPKLKSISGHTVFQNFSSLCEKNPRWQKQKPELPLRAADASIDLLNFIFFKKVSTSGHILFVFYMPTCVVLSAKHLGLRGERERERGENRINL